MGYQPYGTADQMRSSDIWRVKDGKLIEHWDYLIRWKYSSKSARRRL